MNSNYKQDTYTMPLKQLLKLLETTADEAPRKVRRPRVRQQTAHRPSSVSSGIADRTDY
jgi:hypothetical protein